MNVRRIATLAVVLGIFGVIALGWFVGVSPLVTQAGIAQGELAAVQADNALQQQRLEEMRQQFEDLPDLLEALEKAQVSVPSSPQIDAFLDQLQSYATTVTVSSITLGVPVLYGGIPATSTDPSAPPAPATDASGLRPELAAITYTIPITVTINGPLADSFAFVHSLQSGGRLLLVTDVSVLAVEGEQVTTTITAHLFVMRDPRAASIQPSTPVPSATPTPTPTETSTPAPSGSPTPTPTP